METRNETNWRQEAQKLAKALADTEALWRLEREKVKDLEAQRDEMEAVIRNLNG